MPVEELKNMMDSFQEMSDKLNDDVWSNWDEKFEVSWLLFESNFI